MIIYKVQNRIDGKIYVGLTVGSLEKRIARHLVHGYNLFQRALRKYGIQSFDISIIDTANSKESLREKERYWISFHKCVAPSGYNLTGGGEGFWGMSEESKEKLRLSRTGIKQSPEWIANRAKSWIGRKHSEESRQKMRLAKLGRKQSAEHASNGAISRIGLKRSEEAKANMSLVQRGRHCKPFSEEHKRNIGISGRGRKHTEESKLKMSTSHKLRSIAKIASIGMAN